MVTEGADDGRKVKEVGEGGDDEGDGEGMMDDGLKETAFSFEFVCFEPSFKLRALSLEL